jgi:hypothetical protein
VDIPSRIFRPEPTFWPSERQEKLLLAALGSPTQAAQTWRALQSDFVLDELEPGSFDLMALIYRRLYEAGYHDSVVERLKGIYRREWVRANVMLERTREVAGALAEAGVDGLFVEGSPLSERFYPERGTRPSWYVDVLVEPRDFRGALAALAAIGWRPSADFDETTHSERVALLDPDRSVCVLRTTLSYDFCSSPGSGAPLEPLWETAGEFDLSGTRVRVPAATETLLAVCVAGARANSAARLLWLLDAALISRGGAVESDRLVWLATRRGQTLRMRDALSYLARLPDVPPAGDALARLATMPLTRRDRAIYALASGAFGDQAPLPDYLARHLASNQQRSIPTTLATFPGFLSDQWGLARRRDLPLAVAERVVGRVRRRGEAAD